jgi:mono/diheme cytochrome c family protein/DNA-binding beta-propeller fold protein YncE
MSFAMSRLLLASFLLICFSWTASASAAPKVASAKEKAAWANEWSEKVNIELEYSFDSSGPDAWNSAEHPLVFVTTEGPGYGGLLSGVTLPGLAIIDADTREVVASQNYDVLDWGWSNVFEPHGLGTSPDGKWIYLPTGEGSFMTMGDNAGRFLVINARTLKIDKVIKLQGQAHHAKSFVTPKGEQRVILYGWSQPMFVLDPDDDNRVVGSVSHQEQGSEGYLYFASSNGDKIIGTGRYRDFDMRKHLTDNPVWIVDTDTWKVKKWIQVHDSAPVWVNFTSDDKYAYITGARNSIILQLDMEAEKVVTEQRAGVDGPYGNHFGWDNQYIYTIGKGEESHNRGKMVGMVDTSTMSVAGSRSMNQFYTGCIRGDHGTLHPDPEANEMWISCNASFEVVIFDLDRREVSGRVPLPNGGSTHSGAFVSYPDGWDGAGKTLSDMNGLHGPALETKRKLVAGELGGAAAGSVSNVEYDDPLLAEGKRVFSEVAGVGCKTCHGEYAEGDLGVGVFMRGASEGTIRAAIDAIAEMAVVKNVITEEEIKAISAYVEHLGTMQVARTLAKRGRFIPAEITVEPGSSVQVVVQNSGFEAQTFATDSMGFDDLVIPARSSGSIEWRAPDEEGEYTLHCTDCKLEGQYYTVRVAAQ